MAKRCGVSHPTISQWASGYSKIPATRARLVANILGCEPQEISADWREAFLNDWTPPPGWTQRNDKPLDPEIFVIPQLDVAGMMGPGGKLVVDFPDLIQEWRVKKDWLQRAVRNYSSLQNLRIITGIGDSMSPTFGDGDPLLADIGVTDLYDGVYLFRIDDELFIKRLQVMKDHVLAISDNPRYEKRIITPDENFYIVARIVRTWKGADA